MKGIKFNIDETKYLGLTKNYGKKGCFVHIYLCTHYRYYKDEDILITSVSRTVAHEEIHVILRRFGIKYTINEEKVLKRLQKFLYPEIYQESTNSLIKP